MKHVVGLEICIGKCIDGDWEDWADHGKCMEESMALREEEAWQYPLSPSSMSKQRVGQSRPSPRNHSRLKSIVRGRWEPGLLSAKF